MPATWRPFTLWSRAWEGIGGCDRDAEYGPLCAVADSRMGTLVVLDLMSIEECPELFLECSDAVMLALIIHITAQLGQMRLAHRECSVSVLPLEIGQSG